MRKILGLILIGLLAVSCGYRTSSGPAPSVTYGGNTGDAGTDGNGEIQIVTVAVNGRPVTCVIWKQWAGYGAAGGITCDWGH